MKKSRPARGYVFGATATPDRSFRRNWQGKLLQDDTHLGGDEHALYQRIAGCYFTVACQEQQVSTHFAKMLSVCELP